MIIVHLRSWLFFATLLLTSLPLIISNPIEIQRDFSDLSLSTSLNTPLQKRAPELYSEKELSAIRSLARQVATRLLPDDIVFFVGNSGSYLEVPFKQGAFNMHTLPMSGTRDYKKNSKNTPTHKGLKRYYDKILHKRLKAAPFKRIVLVDHSGGGGSVDGFRTAFWEILHTGSPEFAKDVFQVPMVLLNVIDESRKPGSTNPVVNPKTVPVLDKVWFAKKDLVNRMLGDEKIHPRLVPSYPASQWEIPVKDSWSSKDKDAAKDLENQIISDMNKNGGLIANNSPAPKNIKPLPWWLKYIMT